LATSTLPERTCAPIAAPQGTTSVFMWCMMRRCGSAGEQSGASLRVSVSCTSCLRAGVFLCSVMCVRGGLPSGCPWPWPAIPSHPRGRRASPPGPDQTRWGRSRIRRGTRRDEIDSFFHLRPAPGSDSAGKPDTSIRYSNHGKVRVCRKAA
jgi:hypothetical protein